MNTGDAIGSCLSSGSWLGSDSCLSNGGWLGSDSRLRSAGWSGSDSCLSSAGWLSSDSCLSSGGRLGNDSCLSSGGWLSTDNCLSGGRLGSDSCLFSDSCQSNSLNNRSGLSGSTRRSFVVSFSIGERSWVSKVGKSIYLRRSYQSGGKAEELEIEDLHFELVKVSKSSVN